MSDILIRAVKTFLQAFLAVLIVGLTPLVTVFIEQGVSGVKTAGIALAVASLAAGLSALQNFIRDTM